jgi:1-phosphofructokinase
VTRSDGGRVSVLACSLALMVSVERDEGRQVRDIHLHAGGQGFWVARMAARLGAEVTLVTALGGEPGVALEALVRSEGLGLTAVESASPNAVWISDDEEGEIATVAELPSPSLARHEADGLFNALLAAGLESDVTVLTGSPPGVLAAERYTGLAHDLHALDGRVLADLSGDQLAASLDGGVDAVKVAHDEMIAAGLAAGETARSLLSGARKMRKRGADWVLVSRAEKPLLADLDGRRVEVGIPAFHPVNHRGAGDSMTGATAAGMAAGLSPEEILRLAVAAAALNVTRHGLGSGDSEAIGRLAARVDVSDWPSR